MTTSAMHATKQVVTAATLLLLAFQQTAAQNDSPCAQGMTQNDPRHPYVICLPELGRMTGFIPHCTSGRFEGFGQNVRALSDVNGDNLFDWVVTHYRCDTTVNGLTPNEVLLYKGVRGGLPDVQDGKRIGPTEIGSETSFLASGDWDSDGHIDIATRVQIYGDTAGGNRSGYSVAHLVIFWGSENGDYTLSDTTHLESNAEVWLWIGRSVSTDFDSDGVDDLCVHSGTNGLSQGKLFEIPALHIFRGIQGKRWGHNNVSQLPAWQWWNPPSFPDYGPTEYIDLIDQDGDSVSDLIFYSNINSGTGHVSVACGTRGGFPDTTTVQTADLLLSNGHSSLFADVTGDKVPELLVHAGSEEQIKIFIGLKGQRLEQQFGTGNDPARPGEKEWWGKPWARISLPRKISSNWPGSDWLSLGEVSGTIDGNLDGIGDVWVYAEPFLLMYNGGSFMDYMVDAMVNELPMKYWRGLTYLGDIDGSRVPTFAFATGNGIIYIKPSTEVPSTGIRIDLPSGTGKASVHDAPDAPHTLTLTAVPNPVSGEVRVQWDAPTVTGNAEIVVSDITGANITRLQVPAFERSAVWNTHGVAVGTYFITVRIADSVSTVPAVVR